MGLRAIFSSIDDHLTGDRAMRKVRQEHDIWANTVKKGTTYYTALPVLGQDLVNAGRISRVVHGAYVFDRRSGFGPLTGQWLMRDSSTTSWGLWRQHGPLTTQPAWTQRDQDRLDAELDAQVARGMGAEALELFYASPEYQGLARRLEREYPATVAALAA